MPDRQYVYRIEVDARSAGASAAQARAAIQRELGQVRFAPQMQAMRSASPVGGGLPSFAPSGGSSRELIPGLGQLQNLAGYSVAGIAISQLGRIAVDTAVALTEQGTTLRRADFAARQLAGSQERLNNLMRVYQEVTGDAQTEGEAMVKLNQLMAIGFADNEQELRRFVTASRGASLATSKDLEYIQGQLQLTLANQSTMRLDQIGLGVEEVQQRIKRLKDTMPELTTEARFQEAVLGLLTEKYGSLVTSAEAGASGLELFTKQFRELREEMARQTEQGLNPVFESWAVGMGSQNAQAQIRQLRRLANPMLNQAFDFMPAKMEADQIWAFHRSADLFEEVDAAARNGGKGMEELRGRVQELVTEMVTSGSVTEEQIALLGELERVFRLTASGGIVYAEAADEAADAIMRTANAQAIANATFEEAQRLLRASYGGTMYVNLPGVGLQPAQGPGLPSDDYLRQRSIQQSGGFLTPGGADVSDIRGAWGDKWRQENEEATREAIREREQAEKAAIREGEQAYKQSIHRIEDAFLGAASALEDQIRSIPGLFGRSEVTKEQMELAEMGVGQNFADDLRRRLEDEVINKHDWADIDPTAIFSKAGIDLSLPDPAKIALFNQKWADSSLFADADNLSFFNQDAIRAELERQRMSKIGQENIMGLFGLGEDEEGRTVFKDLGNIMGEGMKGGAEEGLAEFSRDAIANVTMQLKSDAAITEYMSVGSTLSSAIFDGLTDGLASSDLVGAITAAVLAQVNSQLDELP